MTKASIILPAWNAEKYIERAIRSIKHQTFTDFECIIVNDGSTDHTSEIVSMEINDDNRFYIIDIPHEGLSNARNIGIDSSQGDIIFYIDADDEIVPETLEHSINFLEDNNLDIAFFNAMPKVSPENFQRKKSLERYFNRKGCYKIDSGCNMLEKMVIHNDFVYSVFIQAARKSAIKKKFFYGMRAQDLLYTTQNFFLAKQVGHLDEFLYIKNTTLDSLSISRHDANYAWSVLKTITELQKFVEEEGKKCEYALERITAQAFQNLTYAVAKLRKEDWEIIRKLPFMERTTLTNLARVVSRLAVKKRIEEEMTSENATISL